MTSIDADTVKLISVEDSGDFSFNMKWDGMGINRDTLKNPLISIKKTGLIFDIFTEYVSEEDSEHDPDSIMVEYKHNLN